jgi:hypothetical protein
VDAVSQGQPARSARWRLLLELLLVLVATLAVAESHVRRPLDVHPDTVRHLLLVRDCLEGDACHLRLATRGGTATVGVFHGAAFVHCVALVRWLGGDLDTVRRFLALLAALAVVLLYALVRAHGGTLTAVIVVVVLEQLRGTGFFRELWNPTLNALPPVLFLALVAAFLRERRPGRLLAAAAVVGVAIQIHLASAALLAVLAVLVAGEPRGRRLPAAVAVLVTVAATIQVISPAMVVDSDAAAFGRMLARWPLVLLGAAAGLGWVAVVARWAARGDSLVRLLAGTYVPPYVALLVVAPQETRYLDVLTPGVVLLAALLVPHAARFVVAHAPALGDPGARERVARLRRPLGWVALSALLAGGLARVPLQPYRLTDFTMPEAERLAQLLRHRDPGLTWADALRRLRGGSDAWLALNGLALYLPRPTRAAQTEPPAGARDPAGVPRPEELAVYLAPHAAGARPGPTWAGLTAPTGRRLLVHRYRSWLRWDDAEACLLAPGERWCALRRVGWDRVPEAQGGFRLLAHRALPALPGLPWPERLPGRLVVRVPVVVPPGAGGRVLYLAEAGATRPADVCTGRVEDARGLDLAGPLPTSSVEIRGGDRGGAGALLMSWEFGGPRCGLPAYRQLVPPLNEIDTGERAAFERLVRPAELGGAPPTSPAAPRLSLADFDAARPPGGATPAEGARFGREPTVPRWYALLVATLLVLGGLGGAVGALRRLLRDQRSTT